MSAASEVCSIVESHSDTVNGRIVLSYSQFAQSRHDCREKYGELYDACFWPRVFLSFPTVERETPAEHLWIETRFLIRFVHEFAQILQTRRELNAMSCEGKITREGLTEYTSRKLKPFYALKARSRQHLLTACRFAACKFVFYHERRGIAMVEDVALGITVWELERAVALLKAPGQLNDERNSNWFSDKVVFSILDAFLEVAGDEDGVLTHAEFSSLTTFSTLSPLFSRSLFHRLAIQSDRSTGMDLEAYAELVLAWNDRNSPIAVKYLFRIFDRQMNGFLTTADILPFIQETVELLRIGDPDAVYEDMAMDIMTEILDIISPAQSDRITALDIIKCKNGYEVFGMMADATELYRHEHRDDQ